MVVQATVLRSPSASVPRADSQSSAAHYGTEKCQTQRPHMPHSLATHARLMRHISTAAHHGRTASHAQQLRLGAGLTLAGAWLSLPGYGGLRNHSGGELSGWK